MSRPSDVVFRALRQISDLSRAEEIARDAPEIALEPILPPGALAGAGTRGVAAARAGVSDIDAMRSIVGSGASALRKLQQDGANARLTPDEEDGLEAIIITTGRPALFIQDGTFSRPPEDWSVLEQERHGIEQTIPSVGRIEVEGHPAVDWVGTGFLVADDVIMTNRHVAKEFCDTFDGRTWGFTPGICSRIDFREELAGIDPFEFAVREVIGVHDRFDLALFRAERTRPAGDTLPACLKVDPAPATAVRSQVYVIGYPASDSRRNDAEVMRKIFRNVYDVKRLQPGEVMRIVPESCLVEHDCSTLGGNSGSCVIDLQTHKVVGLHFGGRYGQANKAVLLHKLIDDPLLKSAGVVFA